jgi:uncharacterized protein YndB with AHSA1/START domain
MNTVPPIKHTIILDAPIQRVWQALTTPAEVAIWLGAIGFEAHLGAEFYFQVDPQGDWDGKTYSEVTALEPPQQLAFTWFVPGLPKTLVTMTLRNLGRQTEFTLEHTGWDQLPPEVHPIRDQLDLGWRDGVLPNLARQVMETRPD